MSIADDDEEDDASDVEDVIQNDASMFAEFDTEHVE
jgi:hypothetical protein